MTHAAIVVDGSSEGSWLGECVLVCLHHVRWERRLVPHSLTDTERKRREEGGGREGGREEGGGGRGMECGAVSQFKSFMFCNRDRTKTLLSAQLTPIFPVKQFCTPK